MKSTSRIRRQVECGHGQESDQDGRDDENYRVEEGFPENCSSSSSSTCRQSITS